MRGSKRERERAEAGKQPLPFPPSTTPVRAMARNTGKRVGDYKNGGRNGRKNRSGAPTKYMDKAGNDTQQEKERTDHITTRLCIGKPMGITDGRKVEKDISTQTGFKERK